MMTVLRAWQLIPGETTKDWIASPEGHRIPLGGDVDKILVYLNALEQQASHAEALALALEALTRCPRCRGDGSPQCVTCDDYQYCNCKPGYGRLADKCWACKGTGISSETAREPLLAYREDHPAKQQGDGND